MNKQHHNYTQYNIWANQVVIEMLHRQEPKILTQEIVGSFKNIRETIRHIWYAEVGWLSRLNGDGWQADKVEQFTGSNRELTDHWQSASQSLHEFAISSDLDSLLRYERRGKNYEIPIREIIHHVCNHGSYHRGQVIMMMRQLGIGTIDQTDYSEWLRIQHNLQH